MTAGRLESPDSTGSTNNNAGVNCPEEKTAQHWTHSMDWRGNIHMNPDAWPVKAQMGADKEASAGALSVLSILSEEGKANMSK